MNETQRDLETNPAYMEASIYGILLKSFGENYIFEKKMKIAFSHYLQNQFQIKCER